MERPAPYFLRAIPPARFEKAAAFHSLRSQVVLELRDLGCQPLMYIVEATPVSLRVTASDLPDSVKMSSSTILNSSFLKVLPDVSSLLPVIGSFKMAIDGANGPDTQ